MRSMTSTSWPGLRLTPTYKLHPILPVHPLKPCPQPRQDFIANGGGLIAGVLNGEAGADEGGEGAWHSSARSEIADVNGDQVHRDAADDLSPANLPHFAAPQFGQRL